MMKELVDLARRSKDASYVLAAADTARKNEALKQVKQELLNRKDEILKANQRDIEKAEADDIDPPLRKRLGLKDPKFTDLLAGIDKVVAANDPIGEVSLATKLDQGLDLYRVACPIGVLCIIFESRPEAVVQIASLALKSANAVILKGGREAKESNEILVDVFRKALPRAGLPADAVQLVSTREDVQALLGLDEYIDLVIPRGSNQLVRHVMENTKIPVLGHADGICHVYVDRAADLEKAKSIVVDAKTQYPAVCNAVETLLVHEDVLDSLLPEIGKALAENGVVMNADEKCLPRLPKDYAKPAQGEDTFRNEYLRLEISIKAVPSVEAAIDHINSFGSHHTDSIVTEDGKAAEAFMQAVGSANVFHNCSTRFADGFRYGFGAEVGVSTNRIHARGPVGMEGLTIYKYRLHGNGQIVGSYGSGEGQRQYVHQPIPFKQFGARAPSLDK